MSKLKLIWGLAKVLMPTPITRALYAGRLPTVDGRTIDPKAQAASDLVALLRDPNTMPSVSESRAQLDNMAARFDMPCPDDVTKTDITLPGAFGDRPARIYTPHGANPHGNQPTVFYLHGGGWVQGSLASHDGLCGRIAKGAGVRVISYDYVLAPEHKFPDIPDDVLAAYRALFDSGLGIDPKTLVVAGDSAGANLAAVLLHDLADTDDPMPAGQVLIYPAVDGRRTSRSMQALAEQPLLPRKRIDWFFDHYLTDPTQISDPRFSVLFSDRLAGQPPALIISGGHDPLFDDAAAYETALTEAGVTVAHVPYTGQVHAFLSVAKAIPEGQKATRDVCEWIRICLGRHR